VKRYEANDLELCQSMRVDWKKLMHRQGRVRGEKGWIRSSGPSSNEVGKVPIWLILRYRYEDGKSLSE